jgi:hypothetical protein
MVRGWFLLLRQMVKERGEVIREILALCCACKY